MAAMKIKLFGRELSCFGIGGQDQESGVAASPDGGGPEPQKNAVSAVACPRCRRSSDNKFCYFNNYNVNQPRHFCRSCERYWTSGGALRNLPMGSGRRKSAKPYTPLVRSKAADSGPLRSPKSSHFDAVVPLPDHSPSTSTDDVSLILSKESLRKASSSECQGASELSLEPINPSPSHARIGPCAYGYGLRGVGDGGRGHGTRPWNAPLWSSIDMAPFMDKHPGERLQAAKTNNCISIPLEENMPDSTVSVGGGSNFSGFLVKYDDTSIQALNAN